MFLIVRFVYIYIAQVVLLWSVKEEAVLAPFAELLWSVRQNNVFDAFDIFIHVTKSNKTMSTSGSVGVAGYYPDSKPAIVKFISTTVFDRTLCYMDMHIFLL